MRKILSTILMFVFLFATSSAYAKPYCFKSFEGGSFVGVRGPLNLNPPGEDDPINIIPGILDEYVFNADGTAIWTQSNSLVYPLSFGTQTIEVGSWRLKDGYVYLTTVSSTAGPVVANGVNDINLTNYTRTTQKFKVIDRNTLQVEHRVIRRIPLGQDPSTYTDLDPASITLNSREVFLLKKIRVKLTDLNGL